jgi:hypothetical protein
MLDAKDFADLIQEFGFWIGNDPDGIDEVIPRGPKRATLPRKLLCCTIEHFMVDEHSGLLQYVEREIEYLLGHNRTLMKNIRAFLIVALFAASICTFSGCATTSQDSYVALNDGSGIEKRQPSPTEDMTAFQKIGYYLVWFSLTGLYAWGGGSAPLLPP